MIGESERVMRLYTARLFPPIWHLGAMGLLIGDPFDDFLRLQGNFFLSMEFIFAMRKPSKPRCWPNAEMWRSKLHSPIAKYVPSLKKEAEEWRYVREKFEEGQRLVRTRFQVGLLSDPEQIAREEQTLFNLYRSQRWELALDRVSSASLLFKLPSHDMGGRVS